MHEAREKSPRRVWQDPDTRVLDAGAVNRRGHRPKRVSCCRSRSVITKRSRPVALARRKPGPKGPWPPPARVRLGPVRRIEPPENRAMLGRCAEAKAVTMSDPKMGARTMFTIIRRDHEMSVEIIPLERQQLVVPRWRRSATIARNALSRVTARTGARAATRVCVSSAPLTSTARTARRLPCAVKMAAVEKERRASASKTATRAEVATNRWSASRFDRASARPPSELQRLGELSRRGSSPYPSSNPWCPAWPRCRSPWSHRCSSSRPWCCLSSGNSPGV